MHRKKKGIQYKVLRNLKGLAFDLYTMRNQQQSLFNKVYFAWATQLNIPKLNRVSQYDYIETRLGYKYLFVRRFCSLIFNYGFLFYNKEKKGLESFLNKIILFDSFSFNDKGFSSYSFNYSSKDFLLLFDKKLSDQQSFSVLHEDGNFLYKQEIYKKIKVSCRIMNRYYCDSSFINVLSNKQQYLGLYSFAILNYFFIFMLEFFQLLCLFLSDVLILVGRLLSIKNDYSVDKISKLSI